MFCGFLLDLTNIRNNFADRKKNLRIFLKILAKKNPQIFCGFFLLTFLI